MSIDGRARSWAMMAGRLVFKRMWLWTGLLSLTLLACGDPGDQNEIPAENYRQDCTVDEDCSFILVGDMCECQCTGAAIHNEAIEGYNADRLAIECDGADNCSPCQEPEVSCVAGMCSITP